MADFLCADGLDAAIIGVGRRCGQPDLVVYDAAKCVDVFMDRDGMTRKEAWEFFELNTAGAWVGEQTPVWVYRLEEDDDA